MTKTKAQIARKKYGCALSELSGGEKAAVTRLFNAQESTAAPTPRATAKKATKAGYIEVTFGRPGINGTKTSIVAEGTNVEEALKQSGFTINASKEGIIEKVSGDVVKFADAAEEITYVIVPGVDSSI